MGRKSAKIAVRKGKSDGLKAKVYGKFGKLIVQCVRAGGADPASNSRLKDLLAQARAANVPREILDRNLKKGTDKSGADYQEALYEARGPGGSGFICEVLTDNLNRSAAEVRTAINRSGGKMADAGSVLFSFSRKGVVRVLAPLDDEDQIVEAALDAGAEDVEPVDEEETTGFKVITAPEDFMAVLRSLQDGGAVVDLENSSLQYIPATPTTVDDEILQANEKMYDALLELDDVDTVFSTVSFA